MNTQTKHTPLLVHLTDGGAIYVTDNHNFSDATILLGIDGDRIPYEKAEATAAFIVRAANLFDDFIVACNDSLDELTSGGNREKTIQTLQDVLTKAKA